MRARGHLGSGRPVPSASSCEVRRLGGGQRREAAPQRRGRACSPCPSRGSCGGGRRKPRAGPRADGAAPPLNGCGSGRAASTAPRPVLLAGAAGPARPPPPSAAVCARPSSGCSASPAPLAIPAGTSPNPPAGVAVPVPLPECSAAGTCRVHGAAGIGASGKALQVSTCRSEHP